MAVVTFEDLLARINAHLGEDNVSDESIAIIEDMTDTYNALRNTDLEARVSTLEKEKEDLDRSWRERYRQRFFSGVPDAEIENNTEVEDESENLEVEETASEITFDDLFKEEE